MKTAYTFIFSLISSISAFSQCENYTGIDFLFVEEEACFECTFIEFVLTTEEGLANDLYFVDVYGSDGTAGGAFWTDGTGFADLCIEPIEGCEPVILDVIFDIYCDDGSLIETTSIPITFFPDLFLEFEPPGCAEDEVGAAYIVNSFTGEVCSEVMTGISGSAGDCETAIPATLSYSFIVNEGSFCEQIFEEDYSQPCGNNIYGCTNEEACNYNQTAVCDDGSCILENCCPRPLSFPNALCGGSSEICIDFEEPLGQSTLVDIYTESGNGFGFEISRDGATVCFIIDIFLSEPCLAGADDFIVQYSCENGEAVSESYVVILFPDPTNFIPSITFPDPCGDPVITNGFCGEVSEFTITPPANDCDNPLPGEVVWTVDPGFNLGGMPDCFDLQGSTSIPPCLVDCDCDGQFCDAVCLDLDVVVSNGPDFATCSFGDFTLEFEMVGAGASVAEYYIDISVGGIIATSEFHFPGDATIYTSFVPIFSSFGCSPSEQEITYNIICPSSGAIIATGSLGTVTVYPEPSQFFPIVIDGTCGVPAKVLAGPCGTVTFDPNAIILDCGPDATIQSYPWSVDFGFIYGSTLPCSTDLIEGEVIQEPCSESPGAPCSIPCVGDGVLSPDCECIIDNPLQVEYTESTDLSACGFDPITIEINIINPGTESINIEITDNFMIFEFISYFPGDPLPIQVDIFPFPEETCFPTMSNINAIISCDQGGIIDAFYIGTLTIYPDLSFTNVEIINASECGTPPQIVSTGCGSPIITNVIEPVNDPVNPLDGYVEWELDFGFDITTAPDGCYDPSLYTGMAPITACTDMIIDCDANNGTMTIKKN